MYCHKKYSPRIIENNTTRHKDNSVIINLCLVIFYIHIIRYKTISQDIKQHNNITRYNDYNITKQ